MWMSEGQENWMLGLLIRVSRARVVAGRYSATYYLHGGTREALGITRIKDYGMVYCMSQQKGIMRI